MNKELIINELKKINYPGYSRDIISFGIVHEILIENTTINISLKLGVEKNIIEEIKNNIISIINSKFPSASVNIKLIESQNNNLTTLSVSEAYKILNLDINNKPTKELVNRAYIKIHKKIHPDVSPETSRLPPSRLRFSASSSNIP